MKKVLYIALVITLITPFIYVYFWGIPFGQKFEYNQEEQDILMWVLKHKSSNISEANKKKYDEYTTLLINRYPISSQAKVFRAMYFLSIGDTENAEKQLIWASYISPNDVGIYIQRANLSAMRGNFDSAINNLRKAKNIKEKTRDTFDIDLRIAELKNAKDGTITKYPETELRKVYYDTEKADILTENGYYIDSYNIIKRCIDKSPTKSDAYISKSILMVAIGDYNGAKRQLIIADSLGENTTEILKKIVEIEKQADYKINQYSEFQIRSIANREYNLAKEIFDGNHTAIYSQGIVAINNAISFYPNKKTYFELRANMRKKLNDNVGYSKDIAKANSL